MLNGGGPNHPELPPLKTFGSQAGFQGGVHAAVATMGAVFARLRGGAGQHVEVSVQESMVSQNEMVFEYWPYMGMIATRLGRKPVQPMEIDAMQGRMDLRVLRRGASMAQLRRHDGRSGVGQRGDFFRRPQARRKLGGAGNLPERMGKRTERARPLPQGAGKARAFRAGLDDGRPAELRASARRADFSSRLTHPVAGTHKYPGAPLKYRATPWQIRMPAPTLGQHNAEIFGGRLGVDPRESNELKAKGVI